MFFFAYPGGRNLKAFTNFIEGNFERFEPTEVPPAPEKPCVHALSILFYRKNPSNLSLWTFCKIIIIPSHIIDSCV